MVLSLSHLFWRLSQGRTIIPSEIILKVIGSQLISTAVAGGDNMYMVVLWDAKQHYKNGFLVTESPVPP
jgi:hypothetical protein